MHGQIMITELADPSDNVSEGRFIELYNYSGGTVDLSGWSVTSLTGSTGSTSTKDLSGSISAGAFYIIAGSSSGFTNVYGQSPDATGASVSSRNGDDGFILFNGTTIIDVNKTRATKEVKTSAVDFEMGNLIKLNHVVGIPKFKDAVQLYDQRRNNTGAGIGTQIGEARVYTLKPESQVSIALTDTTIYDCYLYDIQTYTRLELNSSLSAGDLPDTAYIKGLSSGATGYATTVGSGKSEVFLRQTAGSFIQGESISINGISTTPRTVNNIKQYGAGDIRMVWQDSSSLSGYTTDFQGDTVLDFIVPTGFSVADTITVNNAGVTTSAGNNFINFKVGDVIQYQRPGFSTATYNRVSSITADGLTMTLSAVVNVKGVCDGSLPSSTTTVQFRRGRSSIRNEEQGFLYAPLDDGNIATVDFTGSDLKAVVEATGKTTNLKKLFQI